MDVDGHGRMKCFHLTVTVHMSMQHSHIAKADQPFGRFYKAGEVELINNPHHAVATAGKEDGFHVGVIEHHLQIGPPLVVATRELVLLRKEVHPFHHLIAPGLKQVYGRLHLISRHLTGRRHNGYPVAGFQ